MVKLFANSGDPDQTLQNDQTPHSAESDLGLHCMPITLLGVYRPQWVLLQNPFTHHMDPIKRKSAFKHAKHTQNQIITCMH